MSAATVVFLLMGLGQSKSEAIRTDGESIRQLRLEHMRATTVGYEFLMGTEKQSKLTLETLPVLRWNDSVIDVVDGVLFLFTSRGRPAAIPSVWMRSSGTVTQHQYQLLTDELVVAVRNQQTIWRPSVGRIMWNPVADAPDPAKTRSQRLVQMRAIARQFAGHVFDVHAGGGRIELRLMPSPIYRYEASDSGVVDGAMFALVKGTNPELTLLLETVQDADGLRWQFLLSPLTNRKTEIQHSDKLIWTYVPRHHPTEPFYHIVMRHDEVARDSRTSVNESR